MWQGCNGHHLGGPLVGTSVRIRTCVGLALRTSLGIPCSVVGQSADSCRPYPLLHTIHPSYAPVGTSSGIPIGLRLPFGTPFGTPNTDLGVGFHCPPPLRNGHLSLAPAGTSSGNPSGLGRSSGTVCRDLGVGFYCPPPPRNGHLYSAPAGTSSGNPSGLGRSSGTLCRGHSVGCPTSRLLQHSALLAFHIVLLRTYSGIPMGFGLPVGTPSGTPNTGLGVGFHRCPPPLHSADPSYAPAGTSSGIPFGLGPASCTSPGTHGRDQTAGSPTAPPPQPHHPTLHSRHLDPSPSHTYTPPGTSAGTATAGPALGGLVSHTASDTPRISSPDHSAGSLKHQPARHLLFSHHSRYEELKWKSRKEKLREETKGAGISNP